MSYCALVGPVGSLVNVLPVGRRVARKVLADGLGRVERIRNGNRRTYAPSLHYRVRWILFNRCRKLCLKLNRFDPRISVLVAITLKVPTSTKTWRIDGRAERSGSQHLRIRSQSGSSAWRVGCSSGLGELPSITRRVIVPTEMPKNGGLPLIT